MAIQITEHADLNSFVVDEAKLNAFLATLPKEDRELIEKKRTCTNRKSVVGVLQGIGLEEIGEILAESKRETWSHLDRD